MAIFEKRHDLPFEEAEQMIAAPLMMRRYAQLAKLTECLS